MISYDNYDWQQAVVDDVVLQTSNAVVDDVVLQTSNAVVHDVVLQTSNAALRERALQENVTYDQCLKMGIVKEQSAKSTAFLEQANGQQSVKVKMEEELRRLKSENKQLKSKMSQRQCYRCGREKCPQGSKCPANGQKCSKCKKMNHFAKVCRSSSKGRRNHLLVSFLVLMSPILKNLQAALWLGSLTHRPLVPKSQYKDP